MRFDSVLPIKNKYGQVRLIQKSEATITYSIPPSNLISVSLAGIDEFDFLQSRSRAKRAYTAHQISHLHHFGSKYSEVSLGNTCIGRSGI